MSVDHPDFFLASSEGYDMEEPRRCRAIRRVRSRHRDDLLLIEIEPPLIGQKYGFGGRDVHQVLVATRHQGASLFPIRRWPVYVHVALCLADDWQDLEFLADNQIRSIAWAELYKTEKRARRKAM